MAKALVAARRVLSEVPEEVDTETGVPRKPFDRLNYCGRPTSKSTHYASLDPASGKWFVWMTAKTHCDLAWVCPSCMDFQGGQLFGLVDKALKGVVTLGPDVTLYFATLTLRSAEWRPVGDLTNTITGAYSRMMVSKPLRELRASGYLIGWVRFLEFTTGQVDAAGKKCGTHPHLHVVFVVREGPGEVGRFLDLWNAKSKPGSARPDPGLKYRWVRSLNDESEALGVYPSIGAHPNRQHVKLFVQDEDLAGLTGYLTKEGRTWGLAKELSRGDLKSARLDSMTPRDVLMAASEGNVEAARWFRAYAQATRDVRRMTQSLGYDGDKRKTFCEWAGELFDAHERREALIKQGIGDSPRAVANRQALADQQAYLEAMSDEEYADYEAFWEQEERDREAAERLRVRLFDWTGVDPESLAELRDPRLLLGLHEAIKPAKTAEEARSLAEAYVEAHGLPISFGAPRRIRRSGNERALTDWRKSDRREWEARMEAQSGKVRAALAAKYPGATSAQLDEWTQQRISRRLSKLGIRQTVDMEAFGRLVQAGDSQKREGEMR